jgi:hypothetical protein
MMSMRIEAKMGGVNSYLENRMLELRLGAGFLAGGTNYVR